MHGEVKIRAEGARTRDNHLIEWFSALGIDSIHISSRPELWPRSFVKRGRHRLPPSLAKATWHSPQVLRMPTVGNRRLWWHQTHGKTAVWDAPPPDAAVSWNPFAMESLARVKQGVPIALDLIDDWSDHHQFAGMKNEVEQAYQKAFDVADLVFANAEGTMRLAHRFGRTDAKLILNGVDPEAFSAESAASGPITIGYAGKISERIDIDLVERAVAALPECRFVIAGLSNARAVSAALRRIPGLVLLGDVHYRDYPRLLTTWDIAWIPHRTGADGEIGGDVIKLYEYRAAGLPTFMTPIEGAGRGLPGVRVAPAAELNEELVAFVRRSIGERIRREPTSIPEAVTWRSKAQAMLGALDALASD
jgi:glycosyltransferase involved in cell wall biosynthesis